MMKTGSNIILGSRRAPAAWGRLAAGLLAAIAAALLAGEAPAAPAEPWPRAIEDNSFFVEEAYNQEPGVVQHISTLVHVHRPGQPFDYGFTQEWPVGSRAHQLSYTLPFAWRAGRHGAGDLMLNYRWQWRAGHPGTAVAPRLSLLLPSGSTRPELGGGRTGLQLNLPASRRLSAGLVVHANAGATRILRSNAPDLQGWNLGASAIALVSPRFNVLVEATTSWTASEDGGRLATARETILSPGVRWAIEAGRAEIVPGVALPLSVSEHGVRPGALVYLSIEHSFKRPDAAPPR